MNFSLETHVRKKVSDKSLRLIELNAFQIRIINCDFNFGLEFIKDCLLIQSKSHDFTSSEAR